jgi:hypothetical protein
MAILTTVAAFLLIPAIAFVVIVFVERRAHHDH